MMHLDYQQSGRETVQDVPDRVKPREGRRDWTWHEYRFHLLDHDYNNWMKVEVWRVKAEKPAE